MEVYKFYWFDPEGGYQIFWGLPEKRKDIAKITKESIMQFSPTVDRNPHFF